MDRQIYIKFVKKDGEYRFDSLVEDNDYEKVDEENNIVKVYGTTIQQIKNQEEDKLLSYQFDENKPIMIRIDPVHYNILVEQARKSADISLDEAVEYVNNGLEDIFRRIDKIEPINNNGMNFYYLSYNYRHVKDTKEDKKDKEEKKDDNEKKEMVVNEKVDSKNEVAESEIITEIDVSKIDPKEVREIVKKKVVAQDDAVDAIVNNIYNNQKIIESGKQNLLNTQKANIFVDGPTGTGKTLIAKTVSDILNLPFKVIPATIFSAPGYRGADLEEMLKPLLNQTGGNLELAERGVIVLDEIDKLGVKGENPLEMSKAVQYNLLTYLGGTKIPMEYNGKKIEFDTSKLTFIALGAFTDLRERKMKEAGEGNKYTITSDDYIEEGILKELIGRFSLLTSTQGLGREALKEILHKSEISPLTGLYETAELYGRKVSVSDEIVDQIVELAYNNKTGARALQTVVNGIKNIFLTDLIDPNSKDDIVITQEIVDKYKMGSIRGESR